MNEEEFVAHVDAMRRAQKKYFAVRTNANLEAMRDREEHVKSILKSPPDLGQKGTEILDLARVMLQYQHGWAAARSAVTQFLERTPMSSDGYQKRREALEAKMRVLENTCKKLEASLDTRLSFYYRPTLPGVE